jgi:hypothetical protein
MRAQQDLTDDLIDLKENAFQQLHAMKQQGIRGRTYIKVKKQYKLLNSMVDSAVERWNNTLLKSLGY